MSRHDLSDAVTYHYGAFPPSELDYARLLDPIANATGALARYDQMLNAMHNSEVLLAPLRNQEAVVSSRMEGTISTLDEILQIEAEQEGGDDQAFQNARSEAVETLLYSRALKMAQQTMAEGQPISEHLIRSAHQNLLFFGRGANLQPGSYKTEQNYIGERRQRSVSFVPINPEGLPLGMQALITFINDDSINKLLRTAIAHVEFEALHPFKDGNGRIGRMLITLMLWEYKLIEAPHFYVSGVFEDLRDDYIDKMRDVSASNAWTDWCVFFLQSLTEQAERNMDTARAIFALYEDMKLRFREELNSQWAVQALDFVFTNPTFRNNRFTQGTEIPSHVAMSMTRKLRDANLLREVVPSAGRRPAMYAFQPLIDLVRD